MDMMEGVGRRLSTKGELLANIGSRSLNGRPPAQHEQTTEGDQSDGEKCVAHTFGPSVGEGGGGAGAGAVPPPLLICLMYRPGHYDVLYPFED